MRTVTFADPKVVDFLNANFIVAWNNHSADRTARGQQAVYSPAEIAAYPEGGGGSNLYTVIAAGDGTVLNNLSGYWSAEMFLQELAFSLGLTTENAAGRRAERMRSLQEQAAALFKEHPEAEGKRIKDSPVLRRQAALCLLAACHRPDLLPEKQEIDQLLANFAQSARGRVFV
jgi:hypothetical protein